MKISEMVVGLNSDIWGPGPVNIILHERRRGSVNEYKITAEGTDGEEIPLTADKLLDLAIVLFADRYRRGI